MASRRVTRGATQSIADRWSLPLSARLEEGLRRLGASRPLPIQAASCARVFAGESVAIHSQTGTGKTLAYLLPLVARLRPAAPRQILTVVPSYELGRQTLEFAHDLAGARTAPSSCLSSRSRCSSSRARSSARCSPRWRTRAAPPSARCAPR